MQKDAHVHVGNRLRVRSSEKVPVDGLVLRGLFSSTLSNMRGVPTVYSRIEQWRERRQQRHSSPQDPRPASS